MLGSGSCAVPPPPGREHPLGTRTGLGKRRSFALNTQSVIPTNCVRGDSERTRLEQGRRRSSPSAGPTGLGLLLQINAGCRISVPPC